MWTFNAVFSQIFNVLFLPFQNMTPWIGMIFISLLTGIFMLFIFRLTSNQAAIKRIKNKIKAHLLEMRLYKDNMSLSLKAQGNILLANLKYIAHSARPMLVMIVPLVFILIQMNFWFGYESLNLEQRALLKIKLKEPYNPMEVRVTIQPPPEVVFETPPLRIEEENEIDWRFSAKKKGLHKVALQMGEKQYSKTISVLQKPLSRISPRRVHKNLIDEWLYPTEPPLEKDSPMKSIEIQYSPQRLSFLGLHIHWLVAFFALSIVFGFSLKGLFGVEI